MPGLPRGFLYVSERKTNRFTTNHIVYVILQEILRLYNVDIGFMMGTPDAKQQE